MGSIEEAVALMQAERDELAARLELLDDVLAQCGRYIVGQVDEPDHDDPQPSPGRKVRSLPRPQTTEKKPRPDTTIRPEPAKRTARTESECEQCGRTFKSPAGLGAHRHFHHPADPPAAPDTALEPLRVVHGRPDPPPFLGACSCGKPIPDADAWAAHNRAIVDPAAHRLVRAEAS